MPKSPLQRLNPVSRMIIETHAKQCGYNPEIFGQGVVTGGTWEVSPPEENSEGRWLVFGGYTEPPPSSKGSVVVAECGSRADADLIAAAPKMLALLKSSRGALVRFLAQDPTESGSLAWEIDGLIARIEGEK
jgi:hypothetical protein